MPDCSLLKNEGAVCGIWLEDPEKANDQITLRVMVEKECKRKKAKFTDEIEYSIDNSEFRVITNLYDQRGGCFIMFDETRAPGEAKRIKQGPIFYFRMITGKILGFLGF